MPTEVLAGPSVPQILMLAALQRKKQGEVYAGTVPAKVKARRRAANKAARIARKANR